MMLCQLDCGNKSLFVHRSHYRKPRIRRDGHTNSVLCKAYSMHWFTGFGKQVLYDFQLVLRNC